MNITHQTANTYFCAYIPVVKLFKPMRMIILFGSEKTFFHYPINYYPGKIIRNVH